MKLVEPFIRIEGTAARGGGETAMDQLLINKRINEVLKGNQEAFEEIVTAFQHRLYHVCYRMLSNRQEAEDIAQEAFVRAYTNLHTFDQKRKFSTWLFRIATNLCIDRIRKKKPDYHLDANVPGTDGLTMYSQIAVDEELPEDEVEKMETQQRIQYEIGRLSDRYRSVIILRYIEELPLKEISEILELPLGTVKTRVHRGRAALRKQMGDL